MAKDPILNETVPTKRAALKVAKIVGCQGAHKAEDGWLPCESDEGLLLIIKKGKAAYTEWLEEQEKSFNRIQDYEFGSVDEAEKSAAKLGCDGSHVVRQGVYAPCSSPEELNSVRGTPQRIRAPRLATSKKRVIFRTPPD